MYQPTSSAPSQVWLPRDQPHGVHPTNTSANITAEIGAPWPPLTHGKAPRTTVSTSSPAGLKSQRYSPYVVRTTSTLSTSTGGASCGRPLRRASKMFSPTPPRSRINARMAMIRGVAHTDDQTLWFPFEDAIPKPKVERQDSFLHALENLRLDARATFVAPPFPGPLLIRTAGTRATSIAMTKDATGVYIPLAAAAYTDADAQTSLVEVRSFVLHLGSNEDRGAMENNISIRPVLRRKPGRLDLARDGANMTLAGRAAIQLFNGGTVEEPNTVSSHAVGAQPRNVGQGMSQRRNALRRSNAKIFKT